MSEQSGEAWVPYEQYSVVVTPARCKGVRIVLSTSDELSKMLHLHIVVHTSCLTSACFTAPALPATTGHLVVAAGPVPCSVPFGAPAFAAVALACLAAWSGDTEGPGAMTASASALPPLPLPAFFSFCTPAVAMPKTRCWG